MTQAALHPRLHTPNAQAGTYLGVETALHFGDAAQELNALLGGCGLFDLSWRARISASGKDRVRWLHNMVTNNVRDLPLNRGNYNFVLNAQGRILGDSCIFNRGETLGLETDRAQVETLLTNLNRFIIMDKVELSEVSDVAAIGVGGPKAIETIKTLGVNLNGMESLEIREARIGELRVEVVSGGENKPNWFEIWTDASALQSLCDNLAAAGAKPVGSQALEWWRILRGIPQYGQDIRDRDLPQETGQTHALNFNKGCYIGQEIVERIRSRGQVHRKFTGFEFENEIAPAGKYDSEGKTLAEVTSIARVPLSSGEKRIGLGYVRRAAVEGSPRVHLGVHEASIVELPFAI